ncbi:hypothetical protein FHR97_002928 [Halomonas stenophila]|uniref:Uncharacterized protein n=1 Tax=Halomonas stenophila TaxID=795312 RepID=A0A7W5HKP9_9GAMM|nr:hypothetical protein [Halomonas stenophila]
MKLDSWQVRRQLITHQLAGSVAVMLDLLLTAIAILDNAL